jgi:hypothetical protein
VSGICRVLKYFAAVATIAAVGAGCSPVFRPALMSTGTPVFAHSENRTSIVTTFDYTYTKRRQSETSDGGDGWRTNEIYNIFRFHQTGFFKSDNFVANIGAFEFLGTHDMDYFDDEMSSGIRTLYSFGGEFRAVRYFVNENDFKIGTGWYLALGIEGGSYKKIITTTDIPAVISIFPVFEFYDQGKNHFFVETPVILIGGLYFSMNVGYGSKSFEGWVGIGTGVGSLTETENYRISAGLSYSIPLSHKPDTTNNTAKTNNE